jgi:hypothetical protein
LDDVRARLNSAEWKTFELQRVISGLGAAPAAPPQERAPVSVVDATPDPSGQQPTEGAQPVEPDHDRESDATASAPEPAALHAQVPAIPQAPAATNPARAPAVKAPQPFDWEGLIGVRFFAWLGGAALFIGAGLFLQYSIQHDLISPELRVALGLVFGAGALAFGDYLRVKADRAGQALSGAGVAILYAALFAARTLYHLLGTLPTFAAMIVVTAVAGMMAVKRGAYMLAMLGLFGGMATPYLLSTGEDRPLALFAYVTLLDVGVVVVARQRRWPSLGLLALVGSAGIYFGWALSFLDATKLPYALVAAGALASLFAFAKFDDGPSASLKGWLPRATALAAAAAPLVLSMAVAGTHHLAVLPAVLVPYLIVVSAGAWMACRRIAAPPLLLLAAGLSSITLFLRVDDDLFPAQRTATLLLYALLPAAFFFLWLARRRAPEAAIALASAAVALGASLLIVLRIVSTEAESEPIAPLWLFGVAHVVCLAAIGIVAEKGVFVASAQGLSIAFVLILSSRYSQARAGEFLPAVLVPMVAFWALPWIGPKFARDRAMWLSSAVALGVHFTILYPMMEPVWGAEILGAAAVACGLLSLLMLRHVRTALETDHKDGLLLTAAFGANTLLFVTAAIPILVSNEWITVAWALEGAALAWLLGKVPHRGLFYASIALAGAAFVRLVFNPVVWEYHARSSTPILNYYLYTFGVPALAFFAGAHWLERSNSGRAFRGVRVPPVLRAGSVVLLFVLLNVEIADLYSTGSSITFRFSGGGLSQDMTYSLAWGIFALALLAFGITRRRKPPRIGALAVLVLTIGKVFLHDLWELGALYRVGSILGLAVALLAVSFLTQRFILRAESS